MIDTEKQKALADRLRGKTFGITFVDKSNVHDDDLLLVVNVEKEQERREIGEHVMLLGQVHVTGAVLGVKEGRDVKADTSYMTDAGLALKLVHV